MPEKSYDTRDSSTWERMEATKDKPFALTLSDLVLTVIPFLRDHRDREYRDNSHRGYNLQEKIDTMLRKAYAMVGQKLGLLPTEAELKQEKEAAYKAELEQKKVLENKHTANLKQEVSPLKEALAEQKYVKGEIRFQGEIERLRTEKRQLEEKISKPQLSVISLLPRLALTVVPLVGSIAGLVVQKITAVYSERKSDNNLKRAAAEKNAGYEYDKALHTSANATTRFLPANQTNQKTTVTRNNPLGNVNPEIATDTASISWVKLVANSKVPNQALGK